METACCWRALDICFHTMYQKPRRSSHTRLERSFRKTAEPYMQNTIRMHQLQHRQFAGGARYGLVPLALGDEDHCLIYLLRIPCVR